MLERITLKREKARKVLELIDSRGFNQSDNKQVPWKELYIKNIKIECSTVSKETEIKNIYLEIEDVLTYDEIIDVEQDEKGYKPLMI